MALVLLHQNIQNFVARLREDFRGSERDRTLLLARFILARINDTTFTDAQMQAVFGVTATKWTQIKSKMNAAVTASNTLLAYVGE